MPITLFGLYSSLPTILVLLLCIKLLSFEKQWKKVGLTTFLSLITFFGFLYVLPILNVKYAGPPVLKESVLDGIPVKGCMNPLHWETKLPITTKVFCLNEYRDLGSYEPILIELGQGLFDISWIKGIHIKKYYSKIEFLNTFKNPTDLKFTDIENFLRIHGKDSLNDQRELWLKECLDKSNILSCRPSAHIFIIQEDRKLVKKLLAQGCEHGDPIACFNYYFNKEFSKKEVKKAERLMVKNCQKNKLHALKERCGRIIHYYDHKK